MKERGFTLIEFLITCAVLGVLLALVYPQFARFRENQVLKAGVTDIMSTLNKAQSQALSSIDSSSYGVYFSANQIVVFKGTSYSVGNPSNEVISIVSPASITNVTLGGVSSSSGELYFSRLGGAPNKSGTVTITTPNLSKIITIGAAGTISVN